MRQYAFPCPWFPGPTQVCPKRHLDQFIRFCRAYKCEKNHRSIVVTSWCQRALSSNTVHSNLQPKRHLYWFSHFAGHTSEWNTRTDRQTGRHTDRQTTLFHNICSNSKHPALYCWQCKLNFFKECKTTNIQWSLVVWFWRYVSRHSSQYFTPPPPRYESSYDLFYGQQKLAILAL